MSHRDDVIYCTIHRNGSGQDSGKLDYSINHGRLGKLNSDEAEDLVHVAREMLIELGEYIDACTCAVCNSPVMPPRTHDLPAV